MDTKKIILATTFLAFFVGFFPEYQTLKAYQKMLWTSTNLTKGSKSNDIILSNGKENADYIEWSRIRIGLPYKALTVDFSNHKQLIIQARWEPACQLVNIAVIMSALIILYAILFFSGIAKL